MFNLSSLKTFDTAIRAIMKFIAASLVEKIIYAIMFIVSIIGLFILREKFLKAINQMRKSIFNAERIEDIMLNTELEDNIRQAEAQLAKFEESIKKRAMDNLSLNRLIMYSTEAFGVSKIDPIVTSNLENEVGARVEIYKLYGFKIV